MKGHQILLDHLGDRQAAALMVDGHLDDLLIESDLPAPGTIYRAIADRPVKGQGGMFLKTPDGPAFLRQIKGLSPGDTLLVQVTGYAEPGKALPVTTKLLFKSRYAIVTPDAPGRNISRSIRDEDRREELQAILHAFKDSSDFGIILRSACVDADPEEIADDLEHMLDLSQQVSSDHGPDAETLLEGDRPHSIAWRDWTDPATVVTDPNCFETHGAMDAIDALKTIQTPLSGDAYAYIEPTRALIAIDVNTGRDTSLTAGTKANMALAKALPRLLRTRGLGGQITMDLAPMAKKDRRAFETALKSSFRADQIDTTLAGWTPLGHFELQRKRARQPISELLS